MTEAARTEPKISVGLYLRGLALDPHVASGLLGLEPTRAQRKDEEKVTSAGTRYVGKIGLWALISRSSSSNLDDHVRELTSQINFDSNLISQIPGLDEAYIDVFVAITTEEDGDECVFEIGAVEMTSLSRLQLPVRFTTNLVRP